MDPLTTKQLHEKRADAQKLAVSVTVGKNGVTDATVAELDRHLKKDKLVKVRLLRSATEGGEHDQEQRQAEGLAEATRSVLVDRRGHTAVFWRG